MNYTSVEQSKKLLELGLNPESADIFIPCYGKDNYTEFRPYFREHVTKPDKGDLPCWSVGALLEVMPNIHDGISYCYPQLSKFFNRNGEVQFVCAYVRETLSACAIQSIGADMQIEAAYNMVVWLLENNYIKK